MQKTSILQLPVYNTPSVDTFNIADVNTAHGNLEAMAEGLVGNKDYITIVNQEVENARGGKVNIATRLDDSDMSLQTKADYAYVNTKTQANNIQFKESYATLELLQSAYPTGDLFNHCLTLDNMIYTYANSAWVSTFISANGTGIIDRTITDEKIASTSKIAFKKICTNLVNYATITAGYYVNYLTGLLLASATSGYSEYIALLPNTTYTLSHPISNLNQLAFYDINKAYVSGWAQSGIKTYTFTTGATVAFVRLTFITSQTHQTQLQLGSTATPYEPYDIAFKVAEIEKYMFTEDYFKDGALSEKKVNPSSNIVVKKICKNLINYSALTTGYYIDYTTGAPAVSATNSYSEYIALLPNTTYTLSSTAYNLSQFAMYTSSKVYVNGWAQSGIKTYTFTTGATVAFGRFTFVNSQAHLTQLELGGVATNYEAFTMGIKIAELEKGSITTEYFSSSLSSQLSNVKNVVTVKKDGTGNFISLRLALESITDASETKQYEVQIYEGVYDIMAYYTTLEIDATSFIGLVRNNYVNLKGIGNMNKIILKGELADTFSSTTMNRVSTIASKGNGNFENLIVTAKNLRYAVHDDYSFVDMKRNVSKCGFIKYAGGGYDQAWGEGTYTGSEFVFEDCYFECENASIPYSSHNNVGFVNPSKHKFSNCSFKNINGISSVLFLSLGSTQIDIIEMIGCRMKGGISFTEAVANVGCDYKLTGHSNDIVPVKVITNKIGQQFTYNFAGETKTVYNSHTSIIPKATPIMLNATGSGIVPFITTTDAIFYYGIAFEDIAIGGSGIVRIGGFLRIADTNLTGLAIGDKIGIVNGVLAKVTTGDYIGVVTLTDYIKLK